MNNYETECRACGAKIQVLSNGYACNAKTREAAKHNFYGGFTCNDYCDASAIKRMERSIDNHINETSKVFQMLKDALSSSAPVEDVNTNEKLKSTNLVIEPKNKTEEVKEDALSDYYKEQGITPDVCLEFLFKEWARLHHNKKDGTYSVYIGSSDEPRVYEGESSVEATFRAMETEKRTILIDSALSIFNSSSIRYRKENV